MEYKLDEKNIIVSTPMRPPSPPPCECPSKKSSDIVIPPRKQKHLNIVYKTETYLRRRRIPELIRFMMTKVVSDGPPKPVVYLEKLLNDAMLFRAGHAPAPVLFEKCHLEAILKSFDPMKRGWLSAGQMRRAFMTIGLEPEAIHGDKISYDDALQRLTDAQEKEVFGLLSAGSEFASLDDCP